MTLFEVPEPFQADPPARRVPVRAHLRTVSGPPSSPLARTTDPETSKTAARSITGRTETLILRYFDQAGDYGLTDDDVCEYLHDLHAPTVKSARSRLSRAGLLVASGEQRLSNRGRRSTVWAKP